MTIPLPLLQQVQIASPCPARWEDMTGDAVTRHCAQCDLDVHNLSAMTADEAEDFLRSKVGTGRVCARIYRRADGTILTRDCPVGVALWRRRVGWALGRVGAAVLFLATGGFMSSQERRGELAERLRAVQPFRAVCEWINPAAAPPVSVTALPAGGAWTGGVMMPTTFTVPTLPDNSAVSSAEVPVMVPTTHPNLPTPPDPPQEYSPFGVPIPSRNP